MSKSTPEYLGLVVFISGRGSNLHAILKSPVGMHVLAIVSDNPEADGLRYAEEFDKPAFVISPDDFDTLQEWEEKIVELLDAAAPKAVALAGFMRILSPKTVRAYAGRMVNIHPSLLPAFRGRNTHKRALEAGVKQHGCTVHYVSEVVDGGEILAQVEVPVLPDDTEDTLAARVREQEHILYPKVLAELLT